MLGNLLKRLLRGSAKAPAQLPDALSSAGQSRAQESSAIRLAARKLQYQRRFDESAALLEEALRDGARPAELAQEADLLVELALCRLRQDRFEACIEHLRRALSLTPKHALARRFMLYPAIMSETLAVTRRMLEPIGADDGRADLPMIAMYYFLDTPGITQAARAGYFKLMGDSIRSARNAVPGLRAILLTDQSTVVDKSVGLDDVHRLELDASQLVYSRLRAVAQFLRVCSAQTNVVLLDPDTFFVRDVRHVFRAEFDVAFTMRSDFADSPMDHEPLNVGVIFAKGEGKERAAHFFELCLQHFEDIETRSSVRAFYPEGLRAWRGDQVLPAAVIGWREFIRDVLSARTNRMEVDGCRILFLESGLYNRTVVGDVGKRPQDAYILHFKGEQKVLRARQVTGDHA
jgi:tetratricopeptide (TPR) repeat protein